MGVRLSFAVMALAAALAVVPSTAAQSQDWGWAPMMVFGPFMVILVPVLIIVISVLVLYRLKIKPPRSIFGAPYQPASEALQILQKRLADGEIDEEEFEARKRVLTA